MRDHQEDLPQCSPVAFSSPRRCSRCCPSRPSRRGRSRRSLQNPPPPSPPPRPRSPRPPAPQRLRRLPRPISTPQRQRNSTSCRRSVRPAPRRSSKPAPRRSSRTGMISWRASSSPRTRPPRSRTWSASEPLAIARDTYRAVVIGRRDQGRPRPPGVSTAGTRRAAWPLEPPRRWIADGSLLRTVHDGGLGLPERGLLVPPAGAQAQSLGEIFKQPQLLCVASSLTLVVVVLRL